MLHVLFCFEDELLEYFSLVCNRAFLFPHLFYYIFVYWTAGYKYYGSENKTKRHLRKSFIIIIFLASRWLVIFETKYKIDFISRYD